jgi:glycerate 2-kinase
VSELKEHARLIFDAAVSAADPVRAMRAHWAIDVSQYRNIYVVGAGKAAARMAAEAERKLGSRITAGAVNTKYGHAGKLLRRIAVRECGHPLPDEAGVRGAERIAELAKAADAGDLVLCLISGGASALLPLPVAGLSLAEKVEITRQLLERGADIHQMNTVRKHLSRIKGGQLAAMASPATVISLILSDVIGDNLETIGSGPTAADPTTVEDARAVLTRFGIEGRALQLLCETPKWAAAANHVIGSNRLALDAACRKARALGYRTLLLSSSVQGETRDAAQVLASIAREVREQGHPVRPPACLLSGGETTVTLRGTGKGGRNQEFALAAAIAIAGLDRMVMLAGGTDGTDGPTDAAGGMVGGTTADAGARKALDNNDSYEYLKARDALVITGPTGTNVMDIQVSLIS